MSTTDAMDAGGGALPITAHMSASLALEAHRARIGAVLAFIDDAASARIQVPTDPAEMTATLDGLLDYFLAGEAAFKASSGELAKHEEAMATLRASWEELKQEEERSILLIQELMNRTGGIDMALARFADEADALTAGATCVEEGEGASLKDVAATAHAFSAGSAAPAHIVRGTTVRLDGTVKHTDPQAQWSEGVPLFPNTLPFPSTQEGGEVRSSTLYRLQEGSNNNNNSTNTALGGDGGEGWMPAPVDSWFKVEKSLSKISAAPFSSSSSSSAAAAATAHASASGGAQLSGAGTPSEAIMVPAMTAAAVAAVTKAPVLPSAPAAPPPAAAATAAAKPASSTVPPPPSGPSGPSGPAAPAAPAPALPPSFSFASLPPSLRQVIASHLPAGWKPGDPLPPSLPPISVLIKQHQNQQQQQQQQQGAGAGAGAAKK